MNPQQIIEAARQTAYDGTARMDGLLDARATGAPHPDEQLALLLAISELERAAEGLRALTTPRPSMGDTVEVWSDYHYSWEPCRIVADENPGLVARSVRWGWEVTLAARPYTTANGTRARWRSPEAATV